MRQAMLFSLAGLGLAGCAVDSRDESFARVRSTLESRGDFDLQWRRGTNSAVSDLLDDGVLNADEALRLALLNNADLQAEFDALGVASSELLQASLVPNPMLNASVRFAGGGEIIELGIAQNVIELLLIPKRRTIASEALSLTEAEAASAVLDLAYEARVAFRQYQAQLARVDLYENVVDATFLSADMARRLREAGNIIELDVLQEEALYNDARLQLAEAQGEALRRRESLAALLGLWGSSAEGWSVEPRLPMPDAFDIDPATIVGETLTASLDLETQRHQINLIAREAGLKSFDALVPDAEVGVDAERETDGEWSVGPSASVAIPVFNLGQGVRAKNRARLSQAMNRYTAVAIKLRAETRSAYTAAATTANTSRFLSQTVLPQRSQITEQTQLQFNAMQTGVFRLLDAKKNEIDTAERYLSSLEQHWSARIRLETLRMGRMPQPRFGIDTGGGMSGTTTSNNSGNPSGGH